MGKHESQLLNAATLEWRKAGQEYSLWRERSTVPVMQGVFIEQELRPGLALHGTRVSFSQGICGTGEMAAGLKLIVMLEGQVSARFGDTRLQLGGAQASCVLLSASSSEPFERIVTQAGRQRQIVLSISPEWLAQAGLGELAERAALETLPGQPLASRSWAASAQVLSLAGTLLQAGALHSPLQRLQCESRALDLLLAAMQQLEPQPPQKLDHRARQRIEQLLQLLDGEQNHDWSLSQLARAIGSNPTTLQKQFRQATGHSIAHYVRTQRLQRARSELQQGLSVTEAALNAGYTSPGNFATAFKRQFGQTPRQMRA